MKKTTQTINTSPFSWDADSTDSEDITLLDVDHPGAHDALYRERRDHIALEAKKFRTQGGGLPIIHYSTTEHDTWRVATTKLQELHARSASSKYLRAKDTLNIGTEQIPQLQQLNTRLQRFRFSLMPIEGLIDTRTFLSALNNNTMLCTQYIRHHSQPEYTPEPDIIHEVIGHVPTFTDSDFVAFTKLIGKAALTATEQQLIALERLYWFTVEFGLIEEQGITKVFGAGILSSIGEMSHAFSADIERRPFTVEEVIETEFDFSAMQETLFVAPSFDHLKKATQALIDTF